ncbi:hypothetical protein ABZY57_07265 [Streptomyces sp. NPDC006450]|uniref:NACHT domain-containing protein n=1 Tax=Streptomyces sp. NPDC006450 TaxID=3155458 RepID=UPI0033B08CCD
MYDYESLGADEFQELCQAILVAYYPDVQCFPVGMPDGGRDASDPRLRVADSTVYQVKFRKPTPNKLATPDQIVAWITKALTGELPKVQELASRGAQKYVLMTNAQCSSHTDSGTRDRVQKWLNENMPIPAQVWWRDDLDRRLDSQTEIKRTYGFIRDVTGLAELLGLRDSTADDESFIRIARGDARVSALMKYMMHQYQRDRMVKFKQAELEPQLLDVYIDVPLSRNSIERSLGIRYHSGPNQRALTMEKWAGLISSDVSAAFMTSNRTSGPAAASVLLSEEMAPGNFAPSQSRLVLEGAPGQGKSTVGQYVCQVHRARLLGLAEVDRFRQEHRYSPIRFPFHVDFRDLATWLRRQDPFDIKNQGLPQGWSDTLESFLVAQISRSSGGMKFSISDLDALLRATPALLILDGLDEVPDLGDRRAVVSCVNEALNRIEPFSPSFRTVATSRPSSFSKTPGFSKREYTYFTLGDLPLSLVLEYTDGWLDSRNVGHHAAHEIRQVLGLKLGQPHIVDLARNPMQLAILLWLVRKKGPSLPDKRTALYREYMETFLDREAEKSTIIRDERELILDLHGYVAWELHCLAETGDSTGSISEPKLKTLLKKYLLTRGYKKKKLELVDQLFTGMTDRVMVLTSRVQNTFEFEVQPLREYFAARYLYSTARTSSPGAEHAGNRSDRFEALLRNPYWWNVTRFYAGFSDVGELANLVDLVEDLVQSGGDYSLISYSREVALTLLRDQVFSQKPRSVSKMVEIISSEESAALFNPRELANSNLSLPADSGGEEVVEKMIQRIEQRAKSGVTDFDAAKLLAANASGSETVDWWFTKWSRARTSRARNSWLTIGRIADSLSYISVDQGAEIVARIGEDLRSWHILLDADIPSRSLLTESNFDSFLKAFRAGVHVDILTRRQTVTVTGMCATIASPDQLLYLLQSDGNVGPWTRIGIRELKARAQGDRYERLLHELYSIMQTASAAPNPRNDIRVWVDFHASITDALGGQCRRTLVLGAALGEIRSGNLNRSTVGNMLDDAVSVVIRARYARQQRGNLGWWADQVAGIRNEDDAFFILCCMMRWAPVSAFAENSGPLIKWVRQLDAYTLQILHSAAPPIWLRSGPGIPHDGLASTHPSWVYIVSAKLHRADALAVLENATENCRNNEIAGLMGACRLNILVRSSGKDWSEATNSIIDAHASTHDNIPNRVFHPEFSTMTAPTSRDLLRRATQLPSGLRYAANDTLTADVARRATPLREVSGKDEWFDREAID